MKVPLCSIALHLRPGLLLRGTPKGRALGRISGRIDPEEVLDRIFASFCIGK